MLKGIKIHDNQTKENLQVLLFKKKPGFFMGNAYWEIAKAGGVGSLLQENNERV